jgi:hypothetical protein
VSARVLVRLRHGGSVGLVSGAVVALTACAGSGSVSTDEMTASIVVVAGDMGSQVSVVLSADDRASVGLSDGERVDASARTADGTTTTTLDDTRPSGGAHTYAGGLDGVTTSSTDVAVTLHRGDDPPAVSTVALPGPIFLVQPTAGQEVRRGRSLVLGVNEGAGSNRVEWSGPCVVEGSLDVEQGQPVVVPAGTVRPRPDAEPDARCAVDLTVSRVFTGDLDDAFAGGSITAQRSVAVTVTSLA